MAASGGFDGMDCDLLDGPVLLTPPAPSDGEAMTTTTTTTTRSMGIIGRARATDALARRPRATRERVARRAGGVMVRAMRWRRAREDANAFDGSTRARRARESRMRRFGWTDRTRTRRDERGDAMMGRARAFDETMD
jgi:hypothetical protein